MLETGKTPYVQGTAAEKIEYNVYEENEVLKAKKQQKSNNKSKVKIVFTVLIAFACCLTLIFRYAQITEMNYKLLKINKQYNEIRNENSRLKVEIEKKLDLQTIKANAETRLGMQKPDRHQVVRVSIPKTDFTQVADEYKNINSGNKTAFSKVLDKLSKITGLLY